MWGAGIHIKSVSADYREIQVQLKKRPWTSNYIGVQYGGSMFSMADPFYMVMLIKNLGPDYSVIDKSASIDFLKVGKTKLQTTFKLSQEDLDQIKEYLNSNEKMYWIRKIEIKDAEGVPVAEVTKTIRIKKKKSQQ